MTYTPPKDEDGVRWYGKWAGNPVGRRENKTRCAAEISLPPSWFERDQCSRLRGHGPNGEYCKQHAKKLEMQ